ncbi:hypothetical protein NUW54_g13668 [Trametes sanguinea]|uniref:Uncharacterized protein n=1 Tax=Trametes sanguinea TaxID=158606 RepID=A0ACC1MKU7_9APHY|nr:hypothetical protein NUW54_g13668 [Trametes sanguinea]
MTPLDPQPHSAWADAQYEQGTLYPSNSSSDSSRSTTGTMEYYDPPPYPADADMHSYQSSDMPSAYEPHPSHPAAVHAPRPVRCVGSPSFLAADEPPAHFSPCATQVSQHDDMLMSFSAVAEPTPQIALPHVPPMPSADLVAVHDGAFEYGYEQPIYYCPAPVPQYPVLQYQYSLSAYMPGPQENVDAAMYYSMVATGMVS